MPSPYEIVLGPKLSQLDPRLAAYFSAIPPGSVGHGAGVFTVAGSRRRWMRLPVVIVSALIGGDVVFPVWARDVPFTVTNRPRVGTAAVKALRVFAFTEGSRSMVDEIRAVTRADGTVQLIDVLGARRRLLAILDAEVIGGGLRMRSRGAQLRFGRLRMRFPHLIAPRVSLDETVGEDGRQHVAVTIALPLMGTIYDYRGSFDYEIVPDERELNA